MMIDSENLKQEYTRDDMYKNLEEVNKEIIMDLPGAFIRKAFSWIGGQANKKFKDATKILTEKYKEKQTIDDYLEIQTKQLQTKVSELEQIENGLDFSLNKALREGERLEQTNSKLSRSLNGITRMLPKGSILETLSDDDLKYESLGREKVQDYPTEDLKTQDQQQY